MDDIRIQWLDNPNTWKIAAAFGVIFIVTFVIFIIKHALNRYVKDTSSLYRIKKNVAFIGYMTVLILIAGIFSDRLGGITVALGITGAGIAFALQEVILSVAGWIAITFGFFYKISNRVQLAGVTGDVIDIGVLRTTLMECGQWINGDLYNGWIVKMSNSFVFKEAVFNYSADFPILWDEIALPVKYGSDYGLTKKILGDVAHELVGEYANHASKT